MWDESGVSTPGLSVKLPDQTMRQGQFDVSLPDDRSGNDIPHFDPFRPESTTRPEFEQRKPQYGESSPAEWKSLSADEYQRSFEFGSGPETVGSKKKKQ